LAAIGNSACKFTSFLDQKIEKQDVNAELNMMTSAFQDTDYKKTSNQKMDVVEGIQFLSLTITIVFFVQNKESNYIF